MYPFEEHHRRWGVGNSLPEMQKEANIGGKKEGSQDVCACCSEVGWGQPTLAPPCNVLQHSWQSKHSTRSVSQHRLFLFNLCFYVLRFFNIYILFISSTLTLHWKPASLRGPPCRWDPRVRGGRVCGGGSVWLEVQHVSV